jgi:hypothetical protein
MGWAGKRGRQKILCSLYEAILILAQILATFLQTYGAKVNRITEESKNRNVKSKFVAICLKRAQFVKIA